MTVKGEKLVKMAEQIRDNMAYTPDQDIVAKRIADHLGRFWDPRMLEQIKAYQADNPQGLSPELSAAVKLISSAPEQSNPAH